MERITCKKCGHEWIVRVEKPKSCPMCKQYLEKPKKGGKEVTND
jgi:predicted Zn-ribbon and HTH transcriptional regulator